MVKYQDVSMIKTTAHGKVSGCQHDQKQQHMVKYQDVSMIKTTAHGKVSGCQHDQNNSTWFFRIL